LDVEGGLAVGSSYSGSTAAPANGAIIEGNVGIGTTTPQEALTVRTTNTAVYAPVTSLANSLTDLNFRLVTTRGEASNANGAATTQVGQAYGTGTMSEGLRFFRGTTTNDGSLALVTAEIERMRINSIGNVGIGTNAPSQRLSVAGNVCYTGTIGACSDRRYKTSFTPLNGSLAKVGLLNGLYYQWRTAEFPEKNFSTERQLGFIAQDIQALFPEVVLTDNDGYLSVDYGRLTPVLVEAIKELHGLVQQQQATIDELRASNTTKENELRSIRTQLEANTALMLKLQSVLEAQTRK
jgi:hypothetical protein